MKQRLFVIVILVSAAGWTGCGPAQPYLTADRVERGLVLVLTGIEGRSRFNEEICRGLSDGGVNWAIELVDWTTPVPGMFLLDLWSEVRNRRKARQIVDRIARYHMAYPSRPVRIVAQSGGGAIAVWIAEAMGPKERLDGIVLMAATLSPEYPLHTALTRSRCGIVNFHSQKDWLFLGAGTTLYGTMDGKHTSSAGRVGFTVPSEAARAGPYSKLYQVAWDKQMGRAGHGGGHLSSGAREFVVRYVAPLILSVDWSESLVRAVVATGVAAGDGAGTSEIALFRRG